MQCPYCIPNTIKEHKSKYGEKGTYSPRIEVARLKLNVVWLVSRVMDLKTVHWNATRINSNTPRKWSPNGDEKTTQKSKLNASKPWIE